MIGHIYFFNFMNTVLSSDIPKFAVQRKLNELKIFCYDICESIFLEYVIVISLKLGKIKYQTNID